MDALSAVKTQYGCGRSRAHRQMRDPEGDQEASFAVDPQGIRLFRVSAFIRQGVPARCGTLSPPTFHGMVDPNPLERRSERLKLELEPSHLAAEVLGNGFDVPVARDHLGGQDHD